MVSKRYLIYYSYIGTFFRGTQRQTPREIGGEDPSTVQGLIEIAIERMRPRNPVVTHCASRTDQGVHALKTALAIDLDMPISSTRYIHQFLNRFFQDTDLAIRVSKVQRVSNDFNPRKMPLWRKYIYRFATLKPDSLDERRTSEYTSPITEYDRCYFVSESKFDLEAVNEACQCFIGTRDFITFMGKPSMQPDDVSTQRCVHQLYVEPNRPVLTSSLDDYYNYWHLTCVGKSFVYNQIRRTMTVLLGVAQGHLTVDDVQLMFIDPSPASYPSFLPLAPACGLYLADVFYDPADLVEPDDDDQVENNENVDCDEVAKTKKELIKERLEMLKLLSKDKLN